MKTLAIETSTLQSEVALQLDDGNFLSMRTEATERSSAAITRLIHEMLGEVGLRPREIELLAISIGPGSFSGLRMGCVIAKTWAYSLNTPLVAVPTHEIIAAQGFGTRPAVEMGKLLVVTDAQRQEWFVSEWSLANPELGPECRRPPAIEPRYALQQAVGEKAVFTGTGLRTVAPAWTEAGLVLTPESAWLPRAETLAELGRRRAAAGRLQDPWSLTPLYLRLSAAEEKANAG